jgi:signal transduction histidine kinase
MGTLPHVLLYLLPGVMAGLIALYAWRRRYLRGGQSFTLLMAATCWWCLCHTISVVHPTFLGTYFWALLQYVGIVLIGPCWLLMALAYSGQWWRTRRWMRMSIFVPELLLLTLALTNPIHQLWWSSIEPDQSHAFMWITVTRGPAFWVHSAYAYTCILIGMALLGFAAFRVTTPAQRMHARWMLLAVIIPLAGNMAFLTGLQMPWRDDPTPLFIFASGLVALYANQRYQLVDLGPLAEREIVAGLPDGLVVLDTGGHVVEVNDLAPQLLHIPTERWNGRKLTSLIAQSPLADELSPLLLDLQRPRTRYLTYTLSTTLYGLEVRLRPLVAETGVATGTLLLIRDVSERVRGEAQRTRYLTELSLLNAVARTANTATETERLIRTITEAIITTGEWDRVAVGLRDSRQDLQIVADQRIGTQHGYEGRFVQGSVAAELQTLLQAGVTRCLQHAAIGDALPGVAAQMQREGIATLVIVPLYHQHSPLGILILGHYVAPGYDASQLRLAETIGDLITDAAVRTQLYEATQAADRLKASFLASVSHELRTPLTSIIGYTEMLQRGIYGPPSEKMHTPLAHMRQSGIVLLRLINDILDFSRMEAGHLEIELHAVNLLLPIYNVAGQMQPLISEHGLHLQIELEPDLPPIWANLARFEQVLTNLLSNAIKFTEQGTITIAAHQHGDQIRISVRDTGIGIAAEQQAIIFEEFQRLAQPHGRRVGGTGLGLAICRRLVELMQGSIGVLSAVGEGSTFYCDFAPATTALLQAEVGATQTVTAG